MVASYQKQHGCYVSATGSPTATLLRLHLGRLFGSRNQDEVASIEINSHGVTGGVYKIRERIHRGMLIHDY